MSNMAHVNKPCAHVRSNNHSPIADAAMNAAIRRAPQVVLNSAMTATYNSRRRRIFVPHRSAGEL